MDRSSFKHRFVIAACALLLFPLAASASLATQTGAWAMQGLGQPRILSQISIHRSAEATSIDVVQYRRNQSAPITSYINDESHPMHLVLLRDDFRELTHLHPTMTRGHFKTAITLAAGHRYYVYADSTPHGIGQQVYRFQLREGPIPRTQSTAVDVSNTTTSVGPYTVRVSTTRMIAGQRTMLHIYFNKDGKPATDIEPYLDQPAHAILINTSNLDYLHVDPVREPKGTESELRLPLPPIGPHASYKLWLQFKGGRTLYTAPFTIVAK